MTFNPLTSCRLLRGFDDALAFIEKTWPEQLSEPEGWSFPICIADDGIKAEVQTPMPRAGSTRISLIHTKIRHADFGRATGPEDILYEVAVPVALLKSQWDKFTLYNIRFAGLGTEIMDIEASKPLRHGYYGITGRDPLTRFSEHWRDAHNGTGHLLHKTWHSLLKTGIPHVPVIQISSMAPSIKEIYAAEELAVAKFTLNPLGLNVIPGGEAGIRFLHQLGGLRRTGCVSIEQRDQALVDLEQMRSAVATHYRTGHIRRLSADRVTWVRPHWVGLDRAAA